MLNVIIGDWFYESLPTHGRGMNVQAVHLHSTHLKFGNWHSPLVTLERTESAALSQHGWQVPSFGKG